VSEGPIPNSWKEAIPVVIWVVLVLGFGLLFTDSMGQLFKDPLWRGGFAIVAMLVLLAMLIYRKWLQERFRSLSGLSLLATIIALMLALALSPYVEQQRLPFSTWVSPPKVDGRIAWRFDQPGGSQFLIMTKFNNEDVRIVGFTAHGRNQSSEPITDFSGVIRSDLTNEEKPILLIAQPDPAEVQPELPPNVTAPVPTPTEETYGIPGFAEFDIATYNKGGVTDTDGTAATSFLRNFGPFTLILKYDGASHERHFSKEQIEEQIALMKRQGGGQDILPHVTRKPGAKPVPIR
jgi:hypothetical protein